jgi:hypothetical protein
VVIHTEPGGPSYSKIIDGRVARTQTPWSVHLGAGDVGNWTVDAIRPPARPRDRHRRVGVGVAVVMVMARVPAMPLAWVVLALAAGYSISGSV